MARIPAVVASISCALVLGACGGGESTGTNPPPPPPPPPAGVVSSVSVSPGTASPFEGDTVRLAATPRAANGDPITGKTVTWSTGSPAVATVSSSGLVTALTAGSAFITATVEGKNGVAQVTVQSRVALDLGHQVSKPMGAAGDSLKTISAGGATFALVVPPGALSGNVTITMTPVTAVQGTGLSGGILAGLKLEPSGTVFERPLELRITDAGTVPAGKVLIGFTTPDNGGPLELLPAATVGGVTTVLVPHFSVVGLGAVLPSELAALPQPNPGNRLADFATIAAILAAGGSQLTLAQQLTLAFEAWYARIAPILLASKQGDTELLAAIPEYVYWNRTMDYAGTAIGTSSFFFVPSLKAKSEAGGFDLGTGFADAITRANTDCKAQRSLTKASLVLFWQTQAVQSLGPAFVDAFGLDRFDVLSNFCIQIINTELLFPDPVTPNQTADLKVRFGVKFGTDPNLMLPPHVFNLRIDIHGTTADGPVVVPSAADGRFTQTVVPTGQNSFQADIKACLDPILIGANDVCGTASVNRPFGRTIVGSVQVFTPQGLQGISDVARIEGSLTITGGSGNPVADLEMLTMLQEVTAGVSINDLPNLTDLAGLRNLRTANSLSLQSLPSLPSVDGLDNLRTIPGELLLNALPQVPNLQGLGQLLTIGTLRVFNMPLVSTLAGLHASVGSLSVIDMPVLTSLAGPSFNPVLPSHINLQRNPVLANLGGLRNVTKIGGSLTLHDNPALSLGELALLKEVASSVLITGSVQSISGLGLERILGELRITPALLPQLGSFVLPALTFVERLHVSDSGTCPRTGSPMLIRMALLDRIEQFVVGTTSTVAAACQYDLELPALGLVTGVLSLGFNGFRDVTLGPVIVGSVFTAGNSQTLRSLRFTGAFDVGSVMSVSNNPLLQTLQGSGRAGSVLNVLNNTSFSQAAAQAWAAGVSAPTKHVSGNKSP